MAKRFQTFCLCDNCKHFFGESENTVRWYENVFCKLGCLKEYFEKHASECYGCKAALKSPTEFPLKTPSSVLYFCSEKCLGEHKANKIVCLFCFKRLETNTKPTSGSPIQVFCSSGCSKKWMHSYSDRVDDPIPCVQCESVSSNHKLIYFGQTNQAFCVDNCFSVVEQSNVSKYVTCTQCCEGFLNRRFGVSIIAEKSYDKLFCDKNCLNHFYVNNDKTINCSGCGKLCRYYSMMRNPSISDDEAWCSMACVSASFGKVRSEIMQQVNQVAASAEDSSYDIDDQSEEGDETLIDIETAKNQLDEKIQDVCCDVSSLTRFKIKPITDEEKAKMVKDREQCLVPKCVACKSPVNGLPSILRFEAMDFCNKDCFHQFLATVKKCFSCKADVKEINSKMFVARFGDDLRYFCSFTCNQIYLKTSKLCAYCDATIEGANFEIGDDMNQYCSTDCMNKYAKMYATNKSLGQKRCTDCGKTKPVFLNFRYKDELHPYCSFTCFFFVRYSCGIAADLCYMCRTYHVRTADSAFVVYNLGMSYVMCSKVCMNHFLRKYSSSVKCNFCDAEKDKFHMIILFNNRVNNPKHYCSISCMELMDEVETADMQCDKTDDEMKKPTNSLEEKRQQFFQTTPDTASAKTGESNGDAEAITILKSADPTGDDDKENLQPPPTKILKCDIVETKKYFKKPVTPRRGKKATRKSKF